MKVAAHKSILLCMKSLIDLFHIDYAIGYLGEPIKVGQSYFSVGNTIWKYKIINIIDRHNVEFTIEEIYYNGNEEHLEMLDDEVRKSASKYFVSYNLYAQAFGYFL